MGNMSQSSVTTVKITTDNGSFFIEGERILDKHIQTFEFYQKVGQYEEDEDVQLIKCKIVADIVELLGTLACLCEAKTEKL